MWIEWVTRMDERMKYSNENQIVNDIRGKCRLGKSWLDDVESLWNHQKEKGKTFKENVTINWHMDLMEARMAFKDRKISSIVNVSHLN